MAAFFAALAFGQADLDDAVRVIKQMKAEEAAGERSAPRKAQPTSRAQRLKAEAVAEVPQSPASDNGSGVNFPTVVLSLISAIIGGLAIGVTFLERKRISVLAHNLGFGGSRAS